MNSLNSSTTHTSIWVPVSVFLFHWADFFQRVTALVHRNLFHDDLQCFARSGLRKLFPSVTSCGSPEPPRVTEVLVLTLSFLFIWRFFSDSCHAFSYEWWSLDLQHFQNQKEKHLCRTFADHKYKSYNYQGHHLKPKVASLSLVRKKKQAPKSSLVAQMGVDMNPRPRRLRYI